MDRRDVSTASSDIFEDVLGHLRTSSDILNSFSPKTPANKGDILGNERLRAAIRQAGLEPEQLAELVEVDIKTVGRWLSGGNPYTKHRTKVARALGREEHELWPELAAAPAERDHEDTRGEIQGAWAHPDDPDIPDWRELLEEARRAGRAVRLLADRHPRNPRRDRHARCESRRRLPDKDPDLSARLDLGHSHRRAARPSRAGLHRPLPARARDRNRPRPPRAAHQPDTESTSASSTPTPTTGSCASTSRC